MSRKYPAGAPGPNDFPPRTGRPPATSRAEVLTAARRLIDAEGWDALSLRRLAAEVGIGTATLYRHVRSREDLLLMLLDEHAAGASRPPLPPEPRERIVTAAAALHAMLADWPWAAEVLTSDGFVGLLSEESLWPVEAIVAGAVDAGCSEEEAVTVFRSLWYYTVGEILVRARTRRSGPRSRGTPASADPSAVPVLASIGDRWPELAARDTYVDGLRAFVAGLLDAR